MNLSPLCLDFTDPCDLKHCRKKLRYLITKTKFKSRLFECFIEVMRLNLRHFFLINETNLMIQSSQCLSVSPPDAAKLKKAIKLTRYLNKDEAF